MACTALASCFPASAIIVLPRIWMFAAWILGGAMSLIGALCYAELGSAYPHAGGDYYFLCRAYGGPVSFLYAWARSSVITAGSIALLAFVFGDYMMQVVPLRFMSPSWGSAFYRDGPLERTSKSLYLPAAHIPSASLHHPSLFVIQNREVKETALKNNMFMGCANGCFSLK